MPALRSIALEVWNADHRVRAAVGAVVLTFLLLVAIVGGIPGSVVLACAAVVLAGLPWLFASFGRPYLLDDAAAEIPFAWRGERAGVWATAPPAGGLLALAVLQVLHLGVALALLGAVAGAAGYTWLLVRSERRYERAISLELGMVEQRFGRIADTRDGDPEATQEYSAIL
jgi:sugar phosphate permease